MFFVVCIAERSAPAQEYGSHPGERRRYAQHALHVGRPRGDLSQETTQFRPRWDGMKPEILKVATNFGDVWGLYVYLMHILRTCVCVCGYVELLTVNSWRETEDFNCRI